MSRNLRERHPDKIGTIAVVSLPVSATNEDLADRLRYLRQVRRSERPGKPNVCVVTVDGYNKDERELPEIPEVRAFCRRLVGQGFISYLDASTGLVQLRHPYVNTGTGLGAFEVWAIAEGLVRGVGNLHIAQEEIERFMKVLVEANRRADELIGPFEDDEPL